MMKHLTRVQIQYHSPDCQRGLTTVEFVIIGSLFMLLLFGIIEFGRLLHTWHALNETTRRAARLAAVCQVTDQDDIKAQAIMDGIPIPGFTAANLVLHYQKSDGTDVTGDLTDPGIFNQINYIRASIENYTYQMLLPLFPGLSFDNSLLAPDFSTTMPRESLGITRPSEEPGGGETPLTDC